MTVVLAGCSNRKDCLDIGACGADSFTLSEMNEFFGIILHAEDTIVRVKEKLDYFNVAYYQDESYPDVIFVKITGNTRGFVAKTYLVNISFQDNTFASYEIHEAYTGP